MRRLAYVLQPRGVRILMCEDIFNRALAGGLAILGLFRHRDILVHYGRLGWDRWVEASGSKGEDSQSSCSTVVVGGDS